MKVDEWLATGSFVPQEGRVTISRFAIRSGDASIALVRQCCRYAGRLQEVHLAGEVSPMPVDMLEAVLAEISCRQGARPGCWSGSRSGQVLGGKFDVNLGPGEFAKIQDGGRDSSRHRNGRAQFSGMSIAYIAEMPPVITGNAKLTVSGARFCRRYS